MPAEFGTTMFFADGTEAASGRCSDEFEQGIGKGCASGSEAG
jgi:hypothetical protein